MRAGRAPLWPDYAATYTFMLGQWAFGVALVAAVVLAGTRRRPSVIVFPDG